MATTFSLTSTQITGQYVRNLPVYNTAPKESSRSYTNNQYIAPNSTGATTKTVYATVLGTGNDYVTSLAPGDYVSNNKTSGISFVVFNRVKDINGVNLNVGPNNGSGSNQDGNDSIYVETADHATDSKTDPSSLGVNFIGSSITTGDETSSLTDNDLVVFGSDKSQDSTQVYSISQGSFSANIRFLLAPGSIRKALTVQGSGVQTGNGNDSLIMANTVSTTKIGGTSSGQGNTFDVGEGADLIYFAAPNTIYANNTINLGKKDGTADNQADSLVFNGSNLSNLNGTSTYMTVRGFKDKVGSDANADSIFYNGSRYQTAASASAATGNKIRFSS